MNDSLEYLPTSNFQEMTRNRPSYRRQETIESLSEFVPRESMSCRLGCQSQSNTGRECEDIKYNPLFDDGPRDMANGFFCPLQVSQPVIRGTLKKELENILNEIRIITDKIRNEVKFSIM